MPMPDLDSYTPHRTVTDAAFEGVTVPGLLAEYFHRTDDHRVSSAGRYSMDGRDLLMAWGFTDEEHCRWSAVRDPAGFWHPETAGCPVVRVLRTGAAPDDPVSGLAVRAPTGEWITVDRGRVPVR
ncbi:hypothetical protein AB0M36_12710 [Actinoplanes sp. NPDC051346]|uniref:hypothetical protein n=1 Tax=Actinoplanes sp. NPDC051346 TaxID=3155048 RepID=UPI0034475622